MIRVLIAEASVDVGERLSEILRFDSQLEVVGKARNGPEALELTWRLRPDVIVMGIHLPEMNGFETTKRIMIEAPTPIVILSGGYDNRDIELSMHALRAGALAVAHKPAAPGPAGFEPDRELVATITAMSEVKLVRRWKERAAPEPSLRPAARNLVRRRLVAIVASTGGPAALQRIFSELPRDFAAPILVVQHIATGFIGGLVAWLNAASALSVNVAEDGALLAPQTIYVASDDRHLGVTAQGRIKLSAAAPIGGFRPSADFLLNSVAEGFGHLSIAVMLTGMGHDGVQGLRAVHGAGGNILVQDEATSVVFGMPRAAIEAGLADAVLPLPAIAPRLAQLVCRA